jgi:mercuric ion binding protein
MRRLIAAGLSLAALASLPAGAVEKTVTLSVPGMNCAACPLTIKAALGKVPGVTKVTASYEKKEAVVTFDDTKATVEMLTKATTEAGYPSTPRKDG